jgi:hypothetical protein
MKLLTRAAAAAVLLLVFFAASPGTARGQGGGVYRGRQGRRVGGVTLPTPPYNPNAGVLDRRVGRVRDSPKAARRPPARRNDKTARQGTRRRRRVRRGRNPRPGTPRATIRDRR